MKRKKYKYYFSEELYVEKSINAEKPAIEFAHKLDGLEAIKKDGFYYVKYQDRLIFVSKLWLIKREVI